MMFPNGLTRRLPLHLLVLLLLLLGLASFPQRATAVSTTLVISQFQVAGGGSAASADEFIELHNISGGPVDLNGHRLVYRSASGTTDVVLVAWSVNTPIPAGGFYLITQATGYDGTPAGDVTFNTGPNGALAAASGGLALRNGPTDTGTIIDSVGYGAATNIFVETTTTAAPPANDSRVRGSGGCADSDNNSIDFGAQTPAAPRNSATATAPCGPVNAPVVPTCPATLATTVGSAQSAAVSASDADGVVAAPQITGPPVVGITLTGAAAAPGVGGTATATLNVAANTAAGSYTVVIGFSNGDATPQTAQCSVAVTVAPTPGSVRIRDIQGASHTSPLSGTAVVDVPGVVIAKSAIGFFMQDGVPDSDPATSEGVFVYTGAGATLDGLQPGEAVAVSGQVFEIRPGCIFGCSASSSARNNLTTTQIGRGGNNNPPVAPAPATVTETSLAPLPPATVIGTGGRVPPQQVIEDDVTDPGRNLEQGNTFDPASDGLDFYESLEGMVVLVRDPVVVGPTNTFNAGSPTETREIMVLGDNGANAATRTARGGIVVAPGDFNPERIFLRDSLLRVAGKALPLANVGDRLSSPIAGVIDYNFGTYKLEVVVDAPTVITATLQREVAAAPTAAQLSVGTFNVENLDPGDSQTKFDELASLIVANLQAPDLLAVEEIQDNNGPTNDGVVAADQTFTKLIAAIAAAGGPAYQFRQIDPVDDQDGGEPGGNIRVGFLFRTDRGLNVVDRPGGTPTSATGVISTTSGPALTASPGRIDPTNSAFASSRKPLAGEFTWNGQTIFAIANHFNSKGGDQPLFGRFQPPLLASESQRLAQAEVVRAFVQQIRAIDSQAHVIVLGDLNDFEFSPPLAKLKEAGLTPLVETLPPNERYTYVFEGNSQAIDHILVSSGLLNRALISYDIVHVNAEFAQQASDHDPQVARITFGAAASKVYLPIVLKP